MGVAVQLLNGKADQAEARHYNSQFFCRTNATNFNGAVLESVKYVKLIQLRMDGAGVKWMVLKSFILIFGSKKF